MAAKQVKFDFTGKKALVTGGSRGIRRAVVSALIDANIEKVYVLARNPDNLAKLKEDFPSVETIAVDLCDWEATKNALKDVERLDFLVNNAGIFLTENSAMTTIPEVFDNFMNNNVKSALNVSQQVCPKMLEGDGGVVVNVSSAVTQTLCPGLYAYTSTKVALDALTRQLALEFAPKIRVNSVNPTIVPTDMTRAMLDTPFADKVLSMTLMERLATVEDISNAILFLLSDAAAMINGHCMHVKGGLREF